MTQTPTARPGQTRESLRYGLGLGKRIVDISVSLALIAVLFLPIIFLSLILTLRWRKPPIFSESRIGKDGQAFKLFKFRTLDTKSGPRATHVEPNAASEKRDVSAFLRRFGVDEIPQLWNVIKGDMSLVGPRPSHPIAVRGYSRLRKRSLKIRPGITGLWQIRGELRLRLHRTAAYDLYYFRRASPLLDLWIVSRTLGLFLRGRRIDYFASSQDEQENDKG